jgi:hypothetical protein
VAGYELVTTLCSDQWPVLKTKRCSRTCKTRPKLVRLGYWKCVSQLTQTSYLRSGFASSRIEFRFKNRPLARYHVSKFKKKIIYIYFPARQNTMKKAFDELSFRRFGGFFSSGRIFCVGKTSKWRRGSLHQPVETFAKARSSTAADRGANQTNHNLK